MTEEQLEDKKDISEILFNLASTDRLALLFAVGKRKIRLTDLSRVINSSAQECSRHVTRLAEAGLISKDSEGLFQITPLGKGVQSLLPGLEFLFSNKSYFLSHDLSILPRPFMDRIGELEAGDYVEHFSHVLERIKNTITGGREFVWLISDQPIIVGSAAGSSFFSKDIAMRLVCEPTVDRSLLDIVMKTLPNSEIAFLDEVNLAMGINEKGAGVIFPDLRGEIDFAGGFYSEDIAFRTWCIELFEFYWTKSRKIVNPSGQS